MNFGGPRILMVAKKQFALSAFNGFSVSSLLHKLRHALEDLPKQTKNTVEILIFLSNFFHDAVLPRWFALTTPSLHGFFSAFIEGHIDYNGQFGTIYFCCAFSQPPMYRWTG